MDFMLKMMDSALKLMDFTLNMMDYVLKMMARTASLLYNGCACVRRHMGRCFHKSDIIVLPQMHHGSRGLPARLHLRPGLR